MQTRLRNYKHSILSFEHNVFNMGIHNAGRYCGFDNITRVSALVFNVTHAGTGISYKNVINQTKGPHGVLLTPQGVIIMEDTAIAGLAIETNVGNSEYRYDIIVCDHSHIVTPGGQDATYQVIKGPVGNPIKPLLTDPLKQILVGTIELPPNAADIADCKYTRAKCPDSGDGEDARLLDPNNFKALQCQSRSATDYLNYADTHVGGPGTAYLWAFENDGNVFYTNPAATTYFDGFRIKDSILQQGTRVHILATHNVVFRMSYDFESGPKYSRGYRALTLPAGLCTDSVAGASSLLAVIPAVGETWELEFMFWNNRWLLMKLGGVGTNSKFSRGDIIDWYGDYTSNFDATGLGINLKTGWAICNGNNNTPDLRGKFRVCATNVQAAGRPRTDTQSNMIADGLDPDDFVLGNYGFIQGKYRKNITQANIPDYDLPVTDPGHTHPYNFLVQDEHPSGQAGFEYEDLTSLNTGSAVTGISVNSGGGGEKFELTNPCMALITLMKL